MAVALDRLLGPKAGAVLIGDQHFIYLMGRTAQGDASG
jgi:hypothetical protein